MTECNNFSIEFKIDAVRLILEQGYTCAETSKNLGVNPNIMGRWVKEFESDDGQAFRGNGKLTPELK